MIHESRANAPLASCFMLVSWVAFSSTLKMEAICSSETSVGFQQTTRRYIPRIENFSYSQLRDPEIEYKLIYCQWLYLYCLFLWSHETTTILTVIRSQYVYVLHHSPILRMIRGEYTCKLRKHAFNLRAEI
jgi:hypothetical protein